MHCPLFHCPFHCPIFPRVVAYSIIEVFLPLRLGLCLHLMFFQVWMPELGKAGTHVAILYADHRDQRKSPGVPGAVFAIGV